MVTVFGPGAYSIEIPDWGGAGPVWNSSFWGGGEGREV
jgi:hypothetical protein